MLSRTAARSLRTLAQSSSITTIRPIVVSSSIAVRTSNISSQSSPFQSARFLSSSSTRNKGLSPESADPPAPNPEPHVKGGVDSTEQPAGLSEEEYHKLADAYIDEVLSELEAWQEVEDGVDVEYSVRSSPHANTSDEMRGSFD